MVDRRTAEEEARRAADRARLMRRLDAGEWLRVAEVAELFDVNRATVNRWVKKYNLIRYRETSPVGGHAALELNPVDVQEQLAKRQQVHRGPRG